ncbi:hypothetical protein F5Y14DRAFT_460325 [Nemania sp. NC0429]|nr:hypothetical protein F5Y14DRAFT_460325 [Nemania sp. NC0429]
MSGFEIAGIVLGALPLMISALEHYKSGRSTLASIVKYQGQLTKLLDRLKDQRRAFYFEILDLLRSAEIEEVEDRTDISPEDCMVILKNAKNEHRLQEYLGIHHNDFIGILRRYEGCLKSIARRLKHVQRLPGASKDDLAALLAANLPVDGRFEFTKRISFSIEKGKLNELVDDLGEDKLNLKIIIKGVKTEKKYFLRHSSSTSKRLCSILGQVAASAKALHIAMCQSCTCACQKSHRVFLELQHRIPRKSSNKTIKKGAGPHVFSLVLDLENHLQETHIEASSDDSDDPLEPIQDAHPSITLFRPAELPATIVKVSCICDLIPQSKAGDYIINLELKGLTLDLVQKPYQAPRELSAPITLETVLKRGAADKRLRMRPKQRITLALDVASSIIQLRETCWSSLAFSSKVVKCIVGANGTDPKVSTVAFIEQLSEPGQAVVQGCAPKVALLELAILLLELWNHETLDMWAAEAKFGRTTETGERLMAASEWADETKDCPIHYLNAVEQCLSLCVHRTRKWSDDELLRMYCENVIKPLQESSDVFPDR